MKTWRVLVLGLLLLWVWGMVVCGFKEWDTYQQQQRQQRELETLEQVPAPVPPKANRPTYHRLGWGYAA